MARKNRLRRSPSYKKSGFLRKFILTILFISFAALGVAGFILFETGKPEIVVGKQIQYLGANVELPFQVSDTKSGIRSVEIEIEQDGAMMLVFQKAFPRKAWLQKAGPDSLAETVTIDAKKAGAKDGAAYLVIKVRDFSLNGMFKGNETVNRIPVTIDTHAPKVRVSHYQNYIIPGGSGIVTYTVSEATETHGVKIDDLFFPGFPLGEKGKNFIAYMALPWDATQPESMKVIAVDSAGNEGKASVGTAFKKKKYKEDRINVSDGFLKKKIPEFEQYYPEMSGTMVEKYLYTNNEVRQLNAVKIKEICQITDEQQLWQDKFLRMPGAGKAGYADHRTYFYKGKAIDQQTHLGMDIASTARVDIRAANKGKVVFADYLGIYGNMVILDHGQGLFSLYSHLSRIDTEENAMVEKNDSIGRSGATGMAGGDHLHFSILIHGIFVTPIQWWDQHWIDVNITNIINDSQL